MWPFSTSYPEISSTEVLKEYDYIIIGGGTAGCVLANRLSSDPNVSVLLVERGYAANTWASRVPLFSTDFASDGSRTFKRDSLPERFVGDRIQELFSGRVLGGTSRINSMLYTRGIAAEYNAWSLAGRKGWSHDEVLPLFKKSEHALDPNSGSERGKSGEWMTRYPDKEYFPQTKHVINAGKELGLSYIKDGNSSTSPAFGCCKAQFTIDSSGLRHSAFAAFLDAKLASSRKANLSICTGTVATKIDIKTGDDGIASAQGVYLRSASSFQTQTTYVSAKHEIILSGGPFGNPHILLLSGVGPRDHLDTIGIPVQKHLPGVGSHLQDHFGVPVVYQCPMADSLLCLEQRPITFIREFIHYMLYGTGLLLSPVLELSIFAKADRLDTESKVTLPAQSDARDTENLPDIEIIPIAYDATGKPFDKSEGLYSFLNVLLRPVSSGTIRLASSDPSDPIICDLGTLSTPSDWAIIRTSLRLTLRIAAHMHSTGYPLKEYRVPASTSDADLDAFIKEWGRTTYHYSSSCRMAPEDDTIPGVVNDELQVHGVRGLRVADSSIFPQIPATHLQAPSVMVAEKCAELIKQMW